MFQMLLFIIYPTDIYEDQHYAKYQDLLLVRSLSLAGLKLCS